MADKRKRWEKTPGQRKASLRPRSAGGPVERSRKTSRLASPPDDATMTDKAYALIEELIVTLQLAPGAVLSEVVLANRLSTGGHPGARSPATALARWAGEYLAAPWRSWFPIWI